MTWNNPLIAAVETGDRETITRLIQEDFPLGGSERNWTPLQKAIQLGREEISLELIAAGAPPNQTNPGNYTPLYRAALRNLDKVARALLEAGADVDAQDMEDGKSSLIVASLKNHLSTAEVLLEHGATLSLMTHEGITALEAAEKSLAIRKSPATRERAEVLLSRVRGSCVDLVERVLADVDAPEKALQEALRVASILGDGDAVKALTEKGAKPDAPNAWNLNALTFAAIRGHASLIEELASAGASPTRTTMRMVYFERMRFYDPMGWAVARNHAEALRALVRAGAEVDKADGWGVTPLMRAAHFGFEASVRALLASGANPELRNRRKQRALEVAASAGHEDIAEVIAELTEEDRA